MNGAREYAGLFKTGQYGRLYIVSGCHARGKTFRIQILPENEKAIPNGDGNNCVNGDAVEVYGEIGGQRGWNESYGWLHVGAWQDDFNELVLAKRKEIAAANSKHAEVIKNSKEKKSGRVRSLLNGY